MNECLRFWIVSVCSTAVAGCSLALGQVGFERYLRWRFSLIFTFLQRCSKPFRQTTSRQNKRACSALDFRNVTLRACSVHPPCILRGCQLHAGTSSACRLYCFTCQILPVHTESLVKSARKGHKRSTKGGVKEGSKGSTASEVLMPKMWFFFKNSVRKCDFLVYLQSENVI